MYLRVLIKASTTLQSKQHTEQNSCRSSTTHLAQPNAPAVIAPIQLLPSSPSHVNSSVNANDMMCGSCSFVHSAPTIVFACTCAASNLPSSCIAVQYRVSIALSRPPLFSSTDSHHLVHYKKEGIVLIIRKILTELPHGLPEVLIFTNANPVKRICSEFMCSHLLLLLDRAPVHTELASGELSSMQKPVRYTGTGCVRGGPSCHHLDLFLYKGALFLIKFLD